MKKRITWRARFEKSVRRHVLTHQTRVNPRTHQVAAWQLTFSQALLTKKKSSSPSHFKKINKNVCHEIAPSIRPTVFPPKRSAPTEPIFLGVFDYSRCSIWLAPCMSVTLSVWVLAGACQWVCVFFCLARARWQGMFSQMGLEIWIKWTSNYLDAQSLDDTLLLQSSGVQRLHKVQQQQLFSFSSANWEPLNLTPV